MKVGVLGTGQLACLFAIEGKKSGIEVIPYGLKTNTWLEKHCQPIYSDFSNQEELKSFAEKVDVITFESENIPVEVLKQLSKTHKVLPTLQALEVANDRLLEKQLFGRLDIPTNLFHSVSTAEELVSGADEIGFPSVIKTRSEGYDGKGQYVVKDLSDLTKAWEKLAKVPCILEGFVKFEREISIIAVRDQFKNIVYYPVSENHHQEGILRYSFPSLSDNLQEQAETHIKKIMDTLDYTGCMALEFFEVSGSLLSNEIAPRVHNSGHWTIEGASQSQFVMHLKAITGEALVAPVIEDEVVMVNIIGKLEKENVLSSFSNINIYNYGKELKENRKMGHFTMKAEGKSKTEFLNQLMEVFLAVDFENQALHLRERFNLQT